MIKKEIKLLFFGLFLLINCSKQNGKNTVYQKFKINKNIVSDSLLQNMNKLGVNNDVLNLQSISFGLRKSEAWNRDYICNAYIGENDTLNIWLNNYNGHFGNGILLKVFDQQYFIKSVSPKVLKGIEFEDFKLVKQDLTLNKDSYKIGDKISGYIYFECIADSTKSKKMEGYFQTEIIRY